MAHFHLHVRTIKRVFFYTSPKFFGAYNFIPMIVQIKYSMNIDDRTLFIFDQIYLLNTIFHTNKCLLICDLVSIKVSNFGFNFRISTFNVLEPHFHDTTIPYSFTREILHGSLFFNVTAAQFALFHVYPGFPYMYSSVSNHNHFLHRVLIILFHGA